MDLGICIEGGRKIPHDQEMLPIQSELDVTASAKPEPFLRGLAAGGGPLHGIG